MVRRDNALEQIKAGLPTSRIESWHYTDLRRLLTAVPPHDRTASVGGLAAACSKARPCCPSLNGVVDGAGRAAGRRHRAAARRQADRRQLRAGARDAWRRRRDRRAQRRFRGGRLFRRHRGGRRALPRRSSCRTCRPAAQSHVRLPVRVGDGAKATDRRAADRVGRGLRHLRQQRRRRRRRRTPLADRPGPAG